MSGPGRPRHGRELPRRPSAHVRRRRAALAAVTAFALGGAVLGASLGSRGGRLAGASSGGGSGTLRPAATAPPAFQAPIGGAVADAGERASRVRALRPTTTTLRPSTTTTTTTITTFPAATSTVPATTVPATTVATTTLPLASVAPTTTTAPACAAGLPGGLSTTDGARQVISVEASGYGTTYATLTAWQKAGSCWQVAYGPFEARLGWTGLVAAADKREGDGHTPEGVYGFEPVMYGNVANHDVHYPYVNLTCGDWWDEDPATSRYNQYVVVPCSDTHPPFDNGSSEALWEEQAPYPSFAVIDYNPSDTRNPPMGSAIFLHAGTASPTAGCVSIALPYLDEVLGWMLPADHPVIVMGTASDIGSY